MSKTRTLFLHSITIFILAACASEKVSPTPLPPLIDIVTSPKNYPVLATQAKANSSPKDSSSPKNSFFGLVKLFVEHGLEDIKGTRGTYAAQGTGSVFTRNKRWFIVTAKHIVIPNLNLQSIVLDPSKPDKKITFEKINKTSASVLIGYLSVEPIAIWLPTDDNIDVAVLEFSEDASASVTSTALSLSVNSNNYLSITTGLLGREIKVWGYPAKQSSQMQKPSISDVSPATGYIVVNQSLEQGYSGGLALLTEGDSEKILGMVIRTDQTSQQSIILGWSVVNSILDAAANNTSVVRKVKLSESVTYKQDVSYTFALAHTLSLTATSPPK